VYILSFTDNKVKKFNADAGWNGTDVLKILIARKSLIWYIQIWTSERNRL